MNLAQEFVLRISRSIPKLGHLGLKLVRQAKSKENLPNTLEVTLMNHDKIFVFMILRSGLKQGHLGPETKSPGQINLVNSLEVTFLNKSSQIWLKMLALMLSRSS